MLRDSGKYFWLLPNRADEVAAKASWDEGGWWSLCSSARSRLVVSRRLHEQLACGGMKVGFFLVIRLGDCWLSSNLFVGWLFL